MKDELTINRQMFEKLSEIKSRYEFLENRLQDPSFSSAKDQTSQWIREYSSLGKIVELYEKYKDVEQNIQNYESVLSEGKEDKDLMDLAKEELILLKEKKIQLLLKLRKNLIPADPLDAKNIIMEIRPAAGGDEASLFCQDLFIMYSHYSHKRKWQVEIMSASPGNNGGFKEIIFSVSGSFVYESLKYESGVHRVQRIPKTETQGRVHTSTVTVVVLPSVDKTLVQMKSSDIRVDTFRSSGSGGQHVNTTDSAVRVMHLPSKIVVQCQDEKSQHANKQKAMKVLYARLYDLEMKKKKEEQSQKRMSQIGTGDRSEKIRTYNFPQARVTDHRIGFTLHTLDEFMSGGLEQMIESLKTKYQRNG